MQIQRGIKIFLSVINFAGTSVLVFCQRSSEPVCRNKIFSDIQIVSLMCFFRTGGPLGIFVSLPQKAVIYAVQPPLRNEEINFGDLLISYCFNAADHH